MQKKQISLSTIMSQRVQSLQKQRELTTTGVGTPLNGEQRSLALRTLKTAEVPARTDIALGTLLQSLTTSTVTIKGGTEEHSPILDMIIRSEKHFKDCREGVLQTLVPLPPEEIMKSLVSLSSLMKKQFGETAADQSVRIKALSLQLQDVPADIVLYAMRQIVDTQKEFPVWSDFAKIVNHRKRNRDSILKQLDHLYCMKKNLPKKG